MWKTAKVKSWCKTTVAAQTHSVARLHAEEAKNVNQECAATRSKRHRRQRLLAVTTLIQWHVRLKGKKIRYTKSMNNAKSRHWITKNNNKWQKTSEVSVYTRQCRCFTSTTTEKWSETLIRSPIPAQETNTSKQDLSLSKTTNCQFISQFRHDWKSTLHRVRISLAIWKWL